MMFKKHGAELELKNKPCLDQGFIPFYPVIQRRKKEAGEPLCLAVHQPDGQTFAYDTRIYGKPETSQMDCLYAERLVKLLLWMKGGCRISVCGNPQIYAHIKKAYAPKGARKFDHRFLGKIHERELEVHGLEYACSPRTYELSRPLGRHLDGCRIGFDAGGSDRKVSAVIGGKAVFSEEVIWHPKAVSDPSYHYKEIVAALRKAASHLPRVDAIGISSAGIYINNKTMIASLFIKVPGDLYETQVKDIYIRAAREIANVPLVVCNDGDVSALAGSMYYGANSMLGVAMGTSLAAGYVDNKGNITSALNELAFVPVDLQQEAPVDDWSRDMGCGVMYFSQAAVSRLAQRAGIRLPPNLMPAEKLKEIQALLDHGEPAARKIFETIGCYLGHTVPLWEEFCSCKNLLLQGRVMSGMGGETILEIALQVMKEEYPEIYERVRLMLPDETFRRLGQSIISASLPETVSRARLI